MRHNNRRKRQQKERKVFLFLLSFLIVALGFFVFHYKDSLQFSKTTTQDKTSQVSTNPKVKNNIKKDTNQTKNKTTWTKAEQPVKIPILMYHAIHNMAPEEAASANLIVAPDVFESHIKQLSEQGYYFLSPEEAYRVLSKNELPSDKVVWLTFDDSMIDFYRVAYPILKKYQAKATNNVITGFTQNNSVANLTIDQMKEMKKHGMSFQDHTVNHPDLSQQNEVTQNFEMQDSMEFLDKELSQKTIAIAYPAGRYSDKTLEIASRLNYKLGVTTNEGLASAADGLLSLNRVRILPNTTAEILMATITQ
ncbi:polysaccharide deacetylase family protein [Streptococcus iniae]|uniref:Deacetylase n=1 Tax=Streptococcus iniae TaxID=1346 RepID=F5CV49_STRIN|nr:polysaccharide deacetylase family protein [Streptococcus iniae]AGM98907.1 polysaccharide deacetylase [Streptococcus iniae SF1]AEC32880.1 polysaccharide deacetylase [Streptococcus iniae]AHY15864.1 deacetylase [Streptococcus iniae]AHY17732.1 deacetylase [Streptococcus iniae]AJG26024.1 deacetylase [Streptococcus iniae]